MVHAEHPDVFAQITADVAAELAEQRAFEADAAWQVEPRPVPEGLVRNGTPLGHIAFMGDFDHPNNS